MSAVPDPRRSAGASVAGPVATHDVVTRRLHAAILVLLVAMYVFGWTLGTIPRNTTDRSVWVNLHKSLGLITGLLMLARLAWRLRHRPPPWPDAMPVWQQRAAGAAHALLYGLAILLPAAGFAASNVSKYGVKFFLFLDIGPWGRPDPDLYATLNAAHRALGWVLLALIATHVVAALVHRWRRDAVWQRMWPGN